MEVVPLALKKTDQCTQLTPGRRKRGSSIANGCPKTEHHSMLGFCGDLKGRAKLYANVAGSCIKRSSQSVKIKIKYVALQPRRAKTDWSSCCQVTVQGALWLAKRLSLNLHFSFLNPISLLLIQVATKLSSQGWVDPVPDPILPEKFPGYSRESNPGPLGWQSDVLSTIPNRWSQLQRLGDIILQTHLVK